ncbi:MAG: hypothetical protein CM1200mP9_07470 [Gammaproteobacteria bacterium]|nr:MAG: hypothetical protein CM1200mP9_07470 [Gammaproteobacteria bacterium]
MKQSGRTFAAEDGGEEIRSDNYLRFLVQELKPFIDETYRTQVDRDSTFIVGSSMGGLISAYAIVEYPDVFGGAACLSSDWTIGEDAVLRWLDDHWPAAGAIGCTLTTAPRHMMRTTGRIRRKWMK